MATLEVTGDEIVVRLSRLEKLGALHGDMNLPRSAVRRAYLASQPFSALRGMRAPGTGIPRVVALGTRRRLNGRKDFVALYRGRPAVVIELNAERSEFDRVALSVDSPEAVMALVA